MIERQDFGVRVAGQKAKNIDEFVTKGQLVPGPNINITYNSANDNIVISATATTTTATDGSGRKVRAIIGYIYGYYKPIGGDDGYQKHIPLFANGTNNVAPPNTPNGSNYNLMRYVDIRHNFNLTDKNSFHFEYKTLYTISYNKSTYDNNVEVIPQIIPINGNKIRVYINTPILVSRPEYYLGDYIVGSQNMKIERSSGIFVSQYDLIRFQDANKTIQNLTGERNRVIYFKLTELPNIDFAHLTIMENQY